MMTRGHVEKYSLKEYTRHYNLLAAGDHRHYRLHATMTQTDTHT